MNNNRIDLSEEHVNSINSFWDEWLELMAEKMVDEFNRNPLYWIEKMNDIKKDDENTNDNI